MDRDKWPLAFCTQFQVLLAELDKNTCQPITFFTIFNCVRPIWHLTVHETLNADSGIYAFQAVIWKWCHQAYIRICQNFCNIPFLNLLITNSHQQIFQTSKLPSLQGFISNDRFWPWPIRICGWKLPTATLS